MGKRLVLILVTPAYQFRGWKGDGVLVTLCETPAVLA
jgi:hypothetical protein